MSIGKDTFLFYWSIYMGIVFILWLFQKDEKDNIPDDKKYTDWTCRYILNTSKAAYVKAVLHWCVKNLGVPSGNKKIPQVVISYVKQDKFLGLYCSARKEIIIYIHGHKDLLQLTNTIIHEYDHFLRIKTISDQKNYNSLLNEIGYDKHPLEIYARETAKKYQMICLKAMVENKTVIKK